MTAASEAAYAHGGWKAEHPLQVIGAQMNVAYVVAAALLDGEVLVDQFTQDRINSDDVWALFDKTQSYRRWICPRHSAYFRRLSLSRLLGDPS